MKYSLHFRANLSTVCGEYHLDLLSNNGLFTVYQHNHNHKKILLNGSKYLHTAIATIRTICSDEFISVTTIKALDLPLKRENSFTFTRPELQTCMIIGINQGRYQLARVDNDLDLANAKVLDDEYCSSLVDLKLFDLVQVENHSRTIIYK